VLPDVIYPEWEPYRYHDQLLIVCTGKTIWEDVEKSGWNHDNMDVLCVKDALVYFPGNVNHTFSEHPDQLPILSQLRKARRKTIRHQTTKLRHHTSGALGDVPHVHAWKLPNYGCSGLSACIVGVLLGYEKIVLAGSPLTDEGHFYDPPWVKTSLERSFPGETPKIWKKMADEVFKGKVKSLSGRTKELLGGP